MKRTKRWTALIVAIVLAAQCIPVIVSASDIPFTDVTMSDWYYADVSNAYNLGLIDGRTNSSFAPEENMTHAEAVKLAACMYQVYTKDAPFVANCTPWYEIYADYCYQKGIINREYSWDTPITRGAYIDIFSRALPKEALSEINRVDDGMIPDVAMSHRYAKSIYTMYRAGIVQGQDEAKRCAPDSYVKRGEVAAILSRMMDVTKRVSVLLVNPLLLPQTPADTTPPTPTIPPSSGNITPIYPPFTPIIPPSGGNSDTGSGNSGTGGGTPGTVQPGDSGEITTYFTLLHTPLGQIRFPENWKDNVRVRTLSVLNGYGAEVYGKTSSGEKLLFVLTIGTDSTEGLIGYVGTQDICIRWSTLDFDNSWTQANQDIICAMQEEAMNDGVAQIESFYGFTTEKSETVYEDFVLAATPVGNLMFPGQWKNNIRVQNIPASVGYAVEVYGRVASGEKSLFTIRVGTGDTAGLVGYVSGTDVCIEWSDLTFGSGWTQADEDRVCAMQEEANSLSAQIESLPGFTTQKPQITYEDFVLAVTPIGNLTFPGKWKNNVRTQTVPTSVGYAVEVYGRTSRGEKSLFTIRVGTGDTTGLVGYVSGTDVCIEWSDLTFGSGWTQSDEDAICEMQEYANDISTQIESMAGFTTEKPSGGTGSFILANTPIGSLSCDAQWQGKLQTGGTNYGGVYALDISSTIGSPMRIFTVYIGNTAQGDLLGYVGGARVGYTIHDLDFPGTATSAMIDEIFAMQEEILNSIMDQILAMPGYTSGT